jgi:predicted protein tyrosine phosphatase
MIKTIIHLPQHKAEYITPSENVAMISITDPGTNAYFHYPWKDNLLRIYFEDLCPIELEAIGRKDIIRTANFFSDNDAINIKKFIDQLPESIDTLYIHCRQGKSRSSALAKFIGKKINANVINKSIYEPNPNPHVLRILDDIWK